MSLPQEWTSSWWRHQMETFSALLAICAGNSPVPGEFPTQRSVTRSFDVFLDLRPNKRLSKQWWGWWFETISCPLWCHCNDDLHSPKQNLAFPITVTLCETYGVSDHWQRHCVFKSLFRLPTPTKNIKTPFHMNLLVSDGFPSYRMESVFMTWGPRLLW